MSQDDSHQGEIGRGPNDPRVNVQWTPAVSCSEGLAFILKEENRKLVEALRSYVDVALVRRFKDQLSAEDRDELFTDAVVKLCRKRGLTARFAYLFGKSCKGQPGPLGAYVAMTAKRLHLTRLAKADRDARRKRDRIKRQEGLERKPSPLDLLMDQETLQGFGKKLDKLLAAARSIIDRRHWNALLAFLGARWPVEFGELPPFWPGVVPAANQATRRSDRYRARAELTRLTLERGFKEDEIALLRALRVTHRYGGRGGK